ncbi:mediator of RNA polymerase II transcription subunit 8-like isoform X2 [Chenopodium quinoa]|uniref:mediator of RNA polymerase II transcription subunit 8-like isoform X2 n=1 Tax=Chenopodium quinoa TaxID=63459 RepID=UPI000B799B69|nr:mediator of RNA polymerase II transcription subunit 8-like isoform X2 [Chenopodium quinoa]
MEAMMGTLQDQNQTTSQQQQQQQQQPQQPPQPAKVVEKLNSAVQQQLNLESVKTRAISLFKAISRILEDFDVLSRSNALPKWQDVVGQFSMVNLELFNIVEDIKKVSKAFVVHPRNVNAENATVLPVMLSSKLLPEMEVDDNSKREQLLLGMQNLPIPTQIDKLKARIDMIASACESAEKVIADTRKAYGLDTRQRMSTVPTLDKAFSAKIQEKENLLRAAVNHGEGLRLPADQRHATSPLPSHLVDVLTVGDGAPTYGDGSGMYSKSIPPMLSSNHSNQGTPMQASGGQHLGRSVPSPSTGTVPSSFENTASPMQYANSPRSGTNMMNAPSPQQQTLQQQHQLQQRKMMQLPSQQQQLLAQQQQQYRNSAMQGLAQLQGQNQMQFSQQSANQQYQGRQLPTGHIGQTQLNQGTQLNRHIGQFSGAANTALFNAAQNSPNAPVFALPGGNTQRTHPSQMLSDQMFNIGANQASMMSLPQQQQVPQAAFGSMSQNSQNLQSNMVPLQNASQNLQNFQQQRQQNQQ